MIASRRSRVLVVLDEAGDPETTVARLLATQPEPQDLILLSVLPAWYASDVSDRAQQALARIAHRLAMRGIRADSDVRLGEPVSAIVAAAHEHRADLIAMTRQRPSRLERWLIGSVADDVVRQGSVPVLLLGPTSMGHGGDSGHRRLHIFAERKGRRLEPVLQHATRLAWR